MKLLINDSDFKRILFCEDLHFKLLSTEVQLIFFFWTISNLQKEQSKVKHKEIKISLTKESPARSAVRLCWLHSGKQDRLRKT